MFCLSTLGVLPKRFIYLMDDMTLCALRIFGTARNCQWRKKGNRSGYIPKDTDNKPGSGVSVDQLQSYHPVLVLQFSGKLTSAHIRDSKLMVVHYSNVYHVHLTRITMQE